MCVEGAFERVGASSDYSSDWDNIALDGAMVGTGATPGAETSNNSGFL